MLQKVNSCSVETVFAAKFILSKENTVMATLTAKELTAIEDQLGVEQNLVKKYKMYAQQSQDAQLKTKCEEIAAKHQCHFDTLMGHLN